MNATLSKALVALVPAGIFFAGSLLLFLREKILLSDHPKPVLPHFW